MSKPYRLIWFQHFHKAAGTSIVDSAKQNGETLFPKHENGNPLDAQDRQIQLWNYSNAQLIEFIDNCQLQGISFVATEWGLPDLDTLAADPRVVLISCLRNPLDRFISNFYFDLHYGFTNARSPDNYVASRARTITMHNYYCRVLSGHDNATSDIDQRQFAQALTALRQFNYVADLTNGITPLANYLGWQSEHERHANRSNSSLRQLLGLALRGHWKLLYLRLKYPRREADSEFKNLFMANNDWDMRLFDEVKSTAPD